MKRYATRLRVRLSMLAAMLAFSVDARLPNPVTNSTPPVDAVGIVLAGWAYPRRSGTGFGEQRPRAVHRRELNRREALRTFGRRRSDGHAAMSEGAEAFARDEGANGRRAGGLQLQRPAAGHAHAWVRRGPIARRRRIETALGRLHLDRAAAGTITERDLDRCAASGDCPHDARLHEISARRIAIERFGVEAVRAGGEDRVGGVE